MGVGQYSEIFLLAKIYLSCKHLLLIHKCKKKNSKIPSKSEKNHRFLLRPKKKNMFVCRNRGQKLESVGRFCFVFFIPT